MKIPMIFKILPLFGFTSVAAQASTDCHKIGYLGFLSTHLVYSVASAPRCFGPNAEAVKRNVPVQIQVDILQAGTPTVGARLEARASVGGFQPVGAIVNFQNHDDTSVDHLQRCKFTNLASWDPGYELGGIEIAVRDQNSNSESWLGLKRDQRKFSGYRETGNSRCDFDLQVTESR